jgi:hypothetical protein
MQRRRGERLYERHYDAIRIVTPRQLMESFAAAFLARPHAVHANAADFLQQVKREEIFHPAHHPMVYLAMGWLVVAGRRWAARSNQRWEARFEGGRDAQVYPARFQFLHALWFQIDPGPPRAGLEVDSAEAAERFRRACDILSDAEGCKRFENAAGNAIKRAFTGSKSRSLQVRAQAFAGKVEKGLRTPPSRVPQVPNPAKSPRRRNPKGGGAPNGKTPA